MPGQNVLLLCGSTSWDWIGRKTAKGAPSKDILASLEFESPSIYGPARYIDVKQAVTHCSSSHAVLIDTNGAAYTFGRNDKGQLGNGTKKPNSNPQKISLPSKVTKAATGRGFTLLVTEDYKVFGAGDNKLYQALATSGPDPLTFNEITSLSEFQIIDVACGADFAIALTKDGKMYSWGLPQYGQLGDGSDHQFIAGTNKIVFQPQSPHLINVPLQPNCTEVNIVQISCGLNHSICLDDTGVAYTWGFAGFGRLGLNQGSKDVMTPIPIPGFLERQNPVKKVLAGPSCGMLIDSRNNLHLWGKWKNSGDGGQGTPWLYPKYFQGLNGWEVNAISAGGNTLFALAETSCISWGQGCSHGELGHGKDRSRSATNAVKVDDLEGSKVLSVSCGLGNTLFIISEKDANFKNLEVAGELCIASPVNGAASPTKSTPTKGSPKVKRKAEDVSAESKKAAKKTVVYDEEEESEQEIIGPKKNRKKRG